MHSGSHADREGATGKRPGQVNSEFGERLQKRSRGDTLHTKRPHGEVLGRRKALQFVQPFHLDIY